MSREGYAYPGSCESYPSNRKARLMTSRIKMADVEQRVETINHLIGRVAAWPEDQTGQWQIRAEYGGYYICVVCNEHGGTTRMETGTLRQCDLYVRGVLAGIRAAREALTSGQVGAL